MDKDFACACTTCLRTRVTLNTTRFYTESQHSLEILEKLGDELRKAYPHLRVDTPMHEAMHNKAGFYESLDDAADEHYSRPLFVLDNFRPREDAQRKILDILADMGEPTFTMDEKITIHVHDNTIAIMEWQLRSNGPGEATAMKLNARKFDRLTTMIAKILVEEAGKTCLELLVSTIAKLHTSPRHFGRTIFRNPEKLELFNNLHTGQDTHLWTSRTAVAPFFESLKQRIPSTPELEEGAQSASIWYHKWAEGDGRYLDLPEHQCDCRIGWGNSALAGPGCMTYLDTFLSIQRCLQYFYAVTAIHNRNISQLFMRGFSTKGKALQRTIRQHKLVQTNLYYIESLMFDTENGLQGSSHQVYSAYFEQWRFQKLLHGSQRKAEMANTALGERIAQQRLALQRSLRSLLVALSTIEILGVFVELVSLAHSNETHGNVSWGILRLIRTENADTIITSVMVLLLLLIVMIIVFGIQENSE